MSQKSSYQSIVRSTGIIAGSQLGVLLIGLVRAKLFALWVGPVGIGLLGILNSLLANVAMVAGMGLGTSAVRHVADPEDELTVVRRAVLWLGGLLGVVGGLALFLLREPVAVAVAGNRSLSDEIGWMGVGVALTVFGTALTALLQGLRRLGDLATQQLGGTLIGVLIGLAAVSVLGLDGIVIAAIAAPAGLVLVGVWLQRRIRLGKVGKVSPKRMSRLWRPMLKVGAMILAAAAAAGISQTVQRAIILRELGLDQLGLFQAAIAITTMNITLILTAMAADYYPRLSQQVDDQEGTQRILNEQLHVAVLASLPLLALLSAGSALWLHILYSSPFTPASELMRWLALGEAVRLPLWALNYLLLARRDSVAFLMSEATVSIAMLILTALLVQNHGLVGAGIASVGGLFAGLVVAATAVRIRHGVQLAIPIVGLVMAQNACLLLLALLGEEQAPWSVLAGALIVMASTGYAFTVLRQRNALPRIFNRFPWPPAAKENGRSEETCGD